MYLESPKLFGLIKTCRLCGKKYIKGGRYGSGVCEFCYENMEVMLCRECGREITKAEFNNNNGLCYICDDESDITICLQCGREFIRQSGEIVCFRCEGILDVRDNE